MPAKKTAKKKTSKKPERKLVVERPEDLPTYYANRVGLQVTAWDFRFSFEELIEATEERQVAKVLAAVYLSPSHMKAVQGLIDRQIKLYEDTHGEILDVEAGAG